MDFDYQIRLATEIDALAIAEIHVLAWKAAYQGMIPQSALDDLRIEEKWPGWRGMIVDPKRTTRITVIENDDRIMAWSTHGPYRDDPNQGEVMGLYAHPDFFGTGVGSLLLGEALTYLDSKWDSTVVWALAANQRARKTYERAGFQVSQDNVLRDDYALALQVQLTRTKP